MAASASVDPSCVDPFNIAIATLPLPKLDSDGANGEPSSTGVPVCVWNLTHISFYAFVTHRLRSFFRRPRFHESIVNTFPAHHIGALLLGVGWFFAEPYIFRCKSAHNAALPASAEPATALAFGLARASSALSPLLAAAAAAPRPAGTSWPAGTLAGEPVAALRRARQRAAQMVARPSKPARRGRALAVRGRDGERRRKQARGVWGKECGQRSVWGTVCVGEGVWAKPTQIFL